MAAVDPESDPMCKVLSKDDLPALLTTLSNASHKWELIATFLEIDDGIVKSIHCTQEPQVNKLLEVLRIWLKTVSPPPTVMSLTKALKNKVVGEEKIASDIVKEFSPHSTRKT